MVKTVTKTYCDICEKETSNGLNISYPVIWLADETEGRSTIPYISNKKKLMFVENAQVKF